MESKGTEDPCQSLSLLSSLSGSPSESETLSPSSEGEDKKDTIQEFSKELNLLEKEVFMGKEPFNFYLNPPASHTLNDPYWLKDFPQPLKDFSSTSFRKKKKEWLASLSKKKKDPRVISPRKREPVPFEPSLSSLMEEDLSLLEEK
jgi:hypothetical protein